MLGAEARLAEDSRATDELPTKLLNVEDGHKVQNVTSTSVGLASGNSSRSLYLVPLFAGGLGGTLGAIATCPLEVIKTRQQSSQAPAISHLAVAANASLAPSNGQGVGLSPKTVHSCQYGYQPIGMRQCARLIIDREGVRGLFKGLGPNLVGVAPARSIYFFSYSAAKSWLNSWCTTDSPYRDSPLIHIGSAATGGFLTSTITNPIWLIKTRLQLDRASGIKMLTVSQCATNIFRDRGIRGFWKGVTASYFGISETIVHFVLYEFMKRKWTESQVDGNVSDSIVAPSARRSGTSASGSTGNLQERRTATDFAAFMAISACSKTVASVLTYPHEVARTRMREEGNVYVKFWSTLANVHRHEGFRGLYRGLATQLVKQIPNTSITMCVYEATVYVITKHMFPPNVS